MTTGELRPVIDSFIKSITEERIAAIIAGYDPTDATYVFLEGPRWSTITGERVAFGWTKFTESPIRMRTWEWEEGSFEQVEGDMGWIAGILLLGVDVGGVRKNIRMRGTYVMRRNRDANGAPGPWMIVHEHFSQPTDDPYGVGDWVVLGAQP
jgi:ketosteroid isomerase-like protein